MDMKVITYLKIVANRNEHRCPIRRRELPKAIFFAMVLNLIIPFIGHIS